MLVDLDRINANGRECGAVLGAIIAVLQLTRLVHLTLDAVLQVVTTARACGALVAIFARVAALVHRLAFADAALAGAVARADLTAAWWHARVLRCLAVAAVARPARLADTTIALAGTVIGARAQQILAPLTAEVLALTILARDDLVGIGALVAFAGAAHTAATAVAFGHTRIVARPAHIIIDIIQMHIGHGALAGVAKMLFVTLTDAAHIGAVIVTLLRVQLVPSGAGMLAGTGAQHLQINDHAFVNAHRIDLNGLSRLKI